MQYLRSWLWVPGDSEKKLAKADTSDSDAIVLDLEDSVAANNRPLARKMVRAFLDARPVETRSYQLWVRINALDDSALIDLAAVIGGAPDGVVLPKIAGPEDVQTLSNMLDALETRENLPLGSIKITAVATEIPSAVLRLGEFATAKLPRLVGFNWGAEDLSAAIGATANTDSTGKWTLTYRYARSAVLLAAKAAGIQAIETVHIDYTDTEGLSATSREAAAEGFTGRAAIHPAQVKPINAAFAPNAEEMAEAQMIIEAFKTGGGQGTIGIGGKMFDIPHLKRAQNVVARASKYMRVT